MPLSSLEALQNPLMEMVDGHPCLMCDDSVVEQQVISKMLLFSGRHCTVA